jgi:hypothetical protein
MAETAMDQIVAELRASAPELYPGNGALKNVRVVGHTPKTDHFIYDIVIDMDAGSERVAAKIYRGSKNGKQNAINMARQEAENLERLYGTFTKKKLTGVPRPLGDFSNLGAVVAEKVQGVPIQSVIMKGALLPGFADNGALRSAAEAAGAWLRSFHKATADMHEPFDVHKLLDELEDLCASCKSEGLEDAAIGTIMTGAKRSLSGAKKTLPSSAILCDFTPLNVLVSEQGIGVCDFLKMKPRGPALHDVAHFLACIEALEKYPFCNRQITGQVQGSFIGAYGVTPAEENVLRVLKMKELLKMFAQGRVGSKESAIRKKVMWATVMKRFIQQAAQRSLAPAA